MTFHLENKISNLLQQCTFKQLKQIHAIMITSSLNQNIELSSKFLRRSTEFGGMEYSELIFSQMDKMFCPGIFIWNAMIRGYAFHGPYEKCIHMYDKMNQRGFKPNNYTYPYVMNLFGEAGNHRDGRKVHCQIIKVGYEWVSSVADSLLNFYLKIESYCDFVKNRKLSDARRIFDGMVLKPVELWNRMISYYVNLGEVERARRLFEEMPERDVVSWNSMLSYYARVGDIENAGDLFDQMPEKNVVSWTSMVGAYANSGDLDMARRFFEKIPERNVVSWNSMISNYTRHGKYKEALDLFVQMHSGSVNLDGFTFVSALSACAHLGALEFGKWIHFVLIRDWFQMGVIVGTALIEMYAKCGDVDRAFKVFIKIGQKDIFCWNVMITSLAIHGRIQEAMKIFSIIQKRGLKPNDFTIVSALFACSHGGLVEEGRHIFYSMEKEYGITPKLKHYGCLIDLLGRNGRLNEAQMVVKEMPFEPDIAVWGALLGGCRVRNDFKLAKNMMDKVDELKANEPGVYVLLSNIYASVGQWTEALIVREKMEDKRIWKEAGCSSIFKAVHDGD